IFDNFVKEVNVEGISVDLAAWDNICAEGYENLRRLSYEDAHILLICFDVSMPDSLDNIIEAWNPEANQRLKGVPKILVGCKSDLRIIPEATGPNESIVHSGENVGRQIGALAYFETSAVEQQNVAELFQYAAKAALVKNAAKQKKGIRRFLSRSDIKFRA
ncbi:P-loop containing nucleoside triphosphate hydrolase protein, partial [Lophiotrema nucula]